MSRVHSARRAASGAAMLLAALTLAGGAVAQSVSLADLTKQTHIHGMAFDRADPSRLLLATHHGLFVVDAGGMATLVSPVQDFMGFTPHPDDPAMLFASGHPAEGGSLGLVASSDGGATWHMVSPGLNGPADFHQLDVSAADPKVIYGAFGGIQVSRDGGNTWTMAGPVPDGLIDLAASPADANRLYAATKTGLLRSDDAGASWKILGFGGEIVSLVQAGRDAALRVFVVGRGLLYAMEADPANWATLGNDFGDGVPLYLAADPTNGRRFALADHTGRVLLSLDGGRSWQAFGAE